MTKDLSTGEKIAAGVLMAILAVFVFFFVILWGAFIWL